MHITLKAECNYLLWVSKEPFVTKKSSGVVAQLQHKMLEGLCPDAMSIGIVGGVGFGRIVVLGKI
jgi:hypothetical protein